MKLLKLDLYEHNLELVSELIYETDKNLFRIFLDKNPTNAIKKLKTLIIAGKNSYGHENVYIAEDSDRNIIGILVAFRGDEVTFTEETKIFRDTMNFIDFIKLTIIKPIYDKITASTIEEDDFYIGNLVVASGLRGKGIGGKMLKNTFQLAKDRKCKRVLLDVIFENNKAKNLYERIGFNVCGEKHYKWMGKSEGTYGMEYLLNK